jgi:hypothetical protein
MVVEGGMAVFGVGCGGGIVAELLHWWNLRDQAQLPAYKTSPFYWAITVAMIFAGGFIAWLYFGEHAEGIIALHVGVSTPLILQKLVISIPAPSGAKNVVVSPAPSIRTFFNW